MEKKHLQSKKIFEFTMQDGSKVEVRPVNGETHFDDVGISHGFIHCVDPDTGTLLFHCGISHFDKNAVYLRDWEG